MAQKKRWLDVWIVEANQVYREVPFEVVADWIMQGRLLEDDQLRWSGTADWFRLGSTPAFAAYIPRSEPFPGASEAAAPAAQDEMAAEPYEMEQSFAWKRGTEGEEDDDPDMIPLIDVSLVLLIFFMMISTGIGAETPIKTPYAEWALGIDNPNMIVIGIAKDKETKAPIYSVTVGERQPAEEDKDMQSQDALLARLDVKLAEEKANFEEKSRSEGGNERWPGTDVNVKADEDLASGIVRKLTIELEKRRRSGVVHKYTGVNEKK